MPNCPPVAELAELLGHAEATAEMARHLESCGACSGILASMREESQGVSFTVAALWVKERISCPHSDILLAQINGALSQDEKDYIDFHVNLVECPHCQAEIERLRELVRERAPRRLDRALDESMRKSAVFLEDARRKRRD